MRKRAFIAVLFFLIASFAANTSVADEVSKEYKEYVIKVAGEGKVSTEPDSFTLVFSVESESINLRRATKDNAKKIENIIKEIKKSAVPNMEFSTSTFSFVGDKGMSFIFPSKKYKIKNEVTVKAEKVEYNKLSDYASGAIDVAIQNGATKVRNLSFYLEDKQSAEKKALKDALDDAKDKAASVAKELGVELKEPYNVLNLWFSTPPGPMLYERYAYDKFEAMKAAPMASAQVAPGKKTLTARVELEFKFE